MFCRSHTHNIQALITATHKIVCIEMKYTKYNTIVKVPVKCNMKHLCNQSVAENV